MEHVPFRDFAVFSACAFVWLVVIKQVVDLIRTPGRKVSFEKEYATREEVEQVRADVEVVDGKVETLRADIVRNGDARRIAIEGKVEDARIEARNGINDVKKEIASVANDVSEMRGETKMITQQLARLELRGTGI